jgi:DNA-binding GntR family transcriptional regulator
MTPGERIVEQTLARALGVGQNVVREALISLAHTGFVRRVTNRGTYVTKLSIEEALKLADVRRALESLVCERIHSRSLIEDVDFSELGRTLRGMRDAAERNDGYAFHDCDLRFHRALWELAGNEYLYTALDRVVTPLFAFHILLSARKHEGNAALLEAVEAHEALAEALRRKDSSCVDEIRKLVDLSLTHHQEMAK